MTRKDYVSIAAKIKQRLDVQKDNSHRMAIVLVAHGIADYMEDQNPTFVRVKFINACGIGV